MIDLPSCLAHGAPRKCSQEVLWVGGAISLRPRGHLQCTSSFRDHHYSRRSAMTCLRAQTGTKDGGTGSQSSEPALDLRGDNRTPCKTRAGAISLQFVSK